MVVGGLNKEDYVVWNYTKSGTLTVRSDYHLKMELNSHKMGIPKISSSVASHRGWLELWGPNVLNKEKIHV